VVVQGSCSIARSTVHPCKSPADVTKPKSTAARRAPAAALEHPGIKARGSALCKYSQVWLTSAHSISAGMDNTPQNAAPCDRPLPPHADRDAQQAATQPADR
jgi:hypothetical protein